jgi:hypothetical protein
LGGGFFVRCGPHGTEGGRAEWRGATPDARAAISPTRPDPELVVDAKRRTFTAEYKQRVLAAADAAPSTPAGAL